jgi:hypothetical protein
MTTKNKITNEELKTESEKLFVRLLEESKLWHDYLKHIATLDTGLIIIMATFQDRFIKSQSIWMNLMIAISLGLFALSLVSVVWSQGTLIGWISESADNPNKIPKYKEKYTYIRPAFLAYGSFLLGLLILVIYVLINLLISS